MYIICELTDLDWEKSTSLTRQEYVPLWTSIVDEMVRVASAWWMYPLVVVSYLYATLYSEVGREASFQVWTVNLLCNSTLVWI